MANPDEDVIELGSSDDEKEPAPKKKKLVKNVLVQIPSKLPGVTIKPANTNKINPLSLTKSKEITVTKVSSSSQKLSNPFATKSTVNGKNVQRKQILQKQIKHALPINNSNKTDAPVTKKIGIIPSMPGKMPIKIAKGITTNAVVQPLSIGPLPPGITVKRTSQLQSAAKRMRPNPVNIQAKKNNAAFKPNKVVKGMVYVDLDEDDAAPSSVGPQWYLRPEEQDKSADKSAVLEKKSEKVEETTEDNAGSTEKHTDEVERESIAEKEPTNLEDQNNKEPETPQYIEITIEDSPAKPKKNKRASEVSELAITIDDSPVKAASNKPDDLSGSDEETTATKEKNSKKKLEYPKQTEKGNNSVEIEIELTPVDNAENDKADSQNVDTEVVEVEESPLKPVESFHTSTPKKKQQHKLPLKMNNRSLFKPLLKATENISKPQSTNDDKSDSAPGEFHPIYQNFIDLCFRIENSEDMNKIVEKKIKAYYKQVPKEYTESEVFTDMVDSKINAMKASPEKMYLYIKDVVDELNMQRKITKAQTANVVTVNEEQEKLLYGEESEFDSKRQRQIRKLEKTLKKLHRAIQKLEEQEVDFDDEEDSVYLLTESEEEATDCVQPVEKSDLLKRYKERMIRVHAKFCQLTNTKLPSEPRVQIDARPGQPKGPAKRLEKWINKKVPIGTPLPFPDFHDVLRCVRDANQEDKLCWNEADIMEEARDLFTRCGKKLQRRRQENEWRLAASRIQSELDPVEESEDLKKALENNRREASKRESELLNKFADRQNQLNLEAVEIGDKEANESPVETDDEEQAEESKFPDTKKKRKERLKRLLQKKSKTEANEKDESNVKTNEPEKDTSQDKDLKETKQPIEETQADAVNNEKDPLSEHQNNPDQDPEPDKKNKTAATGSENVETLSEDSSKIDSDIDELHLLQKLHSRIVDSSTLESSDSESPIAISDTLSSGDNRNRDCDVISIENSSYSESEKNNEQEHELVSYSQKKIVQESVDDQVKIECSETGIEKKINRSNNDEYNESVEDILLASSDDETNKEVDSGNGPNSIKENNSEQPNNENTKDTHKKCSDENADTVDASSMESVGNAGVKELIECENSEVINDVTFVETVDDNSKVAEVTSINSIEMVVDDKMTDILENADTSINAAETKDTGSNSTEKENVTMTSITENENENTNNEKSVIHSDIKSAENNKNVEITSSKLTESGANEDSGSDKLDTPKVNGKNVETDKSKTIAPNDNVVDKTSAIATVSEPMEVDDDKT